MSWCSGLWYYTGTYMGHSAKADCNIWSGTLLLFPSFKLILAFTGFCSTLESCLKYCHVSRAQLDFPFQGPEMKLSRYTRFGRFQKKYHIYGYAQDEMSMCTFDALVFPSCFSCTYQRLFLVFLLLLLRFYCWLFSPWIIPFLLIFRNWNFSPSKFQNTAMIGVFL